MLVPSTSFGLVVTLEWDANTEINLGGYGVYVSDAAGDPYTKFGDTTKDIETIDYVFSEEPTTKYFVVDAHDDSESPLRSGYSNEVVYLPGPKGLRRK